MSGRSTKVAPVVEPEDYTVTPPPKTTRRASPTLSTSIDSRAPWMQKGLLHKSQNKANCEHASMASSDPKYSVSFQA